MNSFLNKWYKNHTFIYKILLFISTTLLVVYLFPKTGKFKYSFEKGRPWQSENLYAPFDFAIKKSKEELKAEEQEVILSNPIYFSKNKEISLEAISLYDNKFSSVFKDSLVNSDFETIIYNTGLDLIKTIYKKGLLDNDYNYEDNQPVVIISLNNLENQTEYGALLKKEALKPLVEHTFNIITNEDSKRQLISLFFDIIKSDLSINENLTQQALNEALKKIIPTRNSIEQETLIVAKGQVVEDEQYAILNSLKSEYESQVWNSSNYNLIVSAYTLLVALTLLMLLLFLKKYRNEIYENNTKVTFIFFNIVVMVLLSTIVINFNSIYIYIVPLCVLPLILKAFFDARLGLFTHVLTVLLLGFIVPNSYEYMFLQIIAGIVTILTVSELYKRANLFISVGQITLIYIVAYFAFFVIHEGQISSIKWETFGLFVLCGLATLFVQPLIYVYEKLFGLVSDVSLLELSDTNSKLLKALSNTAPGTFHHSLNVANLAEAAANEIGANAMLARVGALYHDIGKMKNPTYFTENQSTGLNPHEELSNRESTHIIINHVLDGIEIAKKNNLPDRIIDFIRTHHGTSVVYYFYKKEKIEDETVDVLDFSYPGPKPFSKETAILMMCDSVEAASKSLKNPTSSKINDFVEQIISKQLDAGQFLNSNITFKDIETIKKVLKLKLANIYHLRIEYPV